MLEGQVAVLSSGYLSTKESLLLLDSLKQKQIIQGGSIQLFIVS
jgi:hypothetical protein